MQPNIHHRRCAICRSQFIRIIGSRDKICAECYNFRSDHERIKGCCIELHAICISCYKPFARDIGTRREYVTCPRCRKLARDRSRKKNMNQ